MGGADGAEVLAANNAISFLEDRPGGNARPVLCVAEGGVKAAQGTFRFRGKGKLRNKFDGAGATMVAEDGRYRPTASVEEPEGSRLMGIVASKVAEARGKLITWVAAPGPLTTTGERNEAIVNRALKVGAATAVLAVAIFAFASVFRAGTGTHGNAFPDVILAPLLLVPGILSKRPDGSRSTFGKILLAAGALFALDAVRFLLI